MAGGIKFAVEGLSDVLQVFDELAREIGDKEAKSRILVPAVRKAMRPVLDQAKVAAPKDTGALSKHLHIEARRPTRRDLRSKYINPTDTVIAAVTTKAFPKKLRRQFYEENKALLESNKSAYKAKFREFALSQGFPYDARAMAQEFGTAKIPAQPYLRPALESNAFNVANDLGKTLATQITKYKSRKAKK